MSALQQSKLWVMEWSGLPKDALHIYVGLGVFLLAAFLMRWRLSSWRPWAVVAAVTVIGEAWDIIDTLRTPVPVRLQANWHDVWNTLFWPSVLLLTARTGRLRP